LGNSDLIALILSVLGLLEVFVFPGMVGRAMGKDESGQPLLSTRISIFAVRAGGVILLAVAVYTYLTRTLG